MGAAPPCTPIFSASLGSRLSSYDQETTVTIDLIDYYDETTGFAAMERLTGWHCAMMMGFQARGRVPAGGISMEVAVPAAEFMEAVRKRGINFTVEFR